MPGLARRQDLAGAIGRAFLGGVLLDGRDDKEHAAAKAALDGRVLGAGHLRFAFRAAGLRAGFGQMNPIGRGVGTRRLPGSVVCTPIMLYGAG